MNARLKLFAVISFGAASVAWAQPLENGGAGRQSPDERARLVEAQMTDDERLSLIYSLLPIMISLDAGGSPGRDPRVPEDIPRLAG